MARHLFSRIRGRFSEFSGTIEVGADPAQSAAEVTIRAASLDFRPAPRVEIQQHVTWLVGRGSEASDTGAE